MTTYWFCNCPQKTLLFEVDWGFEFTIDLVAADKLETSEGTSKCNTVTIRRRDGAGTAADPKITRLGGADSEKTQNLKDASGNGEFSSGDNMKKQ